jgi:hypothetical protein
MEGDLPPKEEGIALFQAAVRSVINQKGTGTVGGLNVP